MIDLPRHVPARIDPELGVVRRCPGCAEEWPEDEDFWRPRKPLCRACLYEQDEERRAGRRERNREAQRRYRSRRAG